MPNANTAVELSFSHEYAPHLRDDDAEREALGCLLEGSDDESIEPLWFREDRRAILLAIDTCRAEGLLAAAAYADARACREAAARNAEVVRQAMLDAGVWPNVTDPAVELRDCLDRCTQSLLLSDAIRRLKVAHLKRRIAERAEQLSRLAANPLATESELEVGVTACL